MVRYRLARSAKNTPKATNSASTTSSSYQGGSPTVVASMARTLSEGGAEATQERLSKKYGLPYKRGPKDDAYERYRKAAMSDPRWVIAGQFTRQRKKR